MRIIVLGAGFGGLELSSTLSEELGDDAEVVLIDQADGFVFGFSKLDVMFGKRPASEVFHPYEHLNKPGVQFVRATIRSIDPTAKRVETDQGPFQGDIMVVALGADLEPAATPGLVEAGHEFYTPEGAFAVRDVLSGFNGGRVVVGVTSTPFKCPPAPSETVLLMHDYLTERGCETTRPSRWSCHWASRFRPHRRHPKHCWRPSPNGISPGIPIGWSKGWTRTARSRCSATEMRCPSISFLGVPRHKAPSVVEESGMTVDGWIPVDSAHAGDGVP